MIQKISEFCRTNNIIRPHETIIVGVSGGADSVCLLLVLRELQKELDFDIRVIHVEHGIRGEESRRDAGFVRELCARLGVDWEQVSVDVPAYAKAHGVGEEEGARILRYEAFEHAARECDGSVALAHHMEDNAETIVFQMLRGSGLKGMCGMQPVRLQEDGVRYIRPLLAVSRREIEDYLEKVNQTFCTDGTNADTAYSRNKLRQVVFPLLEEVNAQSVQHINNTANQLSMVWDYMDKQAEAAFGAVCRVNEAEGRAEVDITGIKELHPAIRNQVLYRMLALVAGRRKDISGVHVEQILRLIEGQSGRGINLPYGVAAVREYDRLILVKTMGGKKPGKAAGCGFIQENGRPETICSADSDPMNTKAQIGGENNKAQEIMDSENSVTDISGLIRECVATGSKKKAALGADGEFLEISVHKFAGNMNEIPKKTYTKWFDYDKIKDGLSVRKRRSGDYLVTDSAGHTKKLKEYFINEKVPLSKRDSIWLLAIGQEIVWVTGGRISEKYKVLEDSETIIEISYNGGN